MSQKWIRAYRMRLVCKCGYERRHMELKPRKEGDRKKYIANCDPCGISLHASSLGKLRQKWKEMGGKVEWVREEPINLKENSNSKDQSR